MKFINQKSYDDTCIHHKIAASKHIYSLDVLPLLFNIYSESFYTVVDDKGLTVWEVLLTSYDYASINGQMHMIRSSIYM